MGMFLRANFRTLPEYSARKSRLERLRTLTDVNCPHCQNEWGQNGYAQTQHWRGVPSVPTVPTPLRLNGGRGVESLKPPNARPPWALHFCVREFRRGGCQGSCLMDGPGIGDGFEGSAAERPIAAPAPLSNGPLQSGLAADTSIRGASQPWADGVQRLNPMMACLPAARFDCWPAPRRHARCWLLH